MGKLLIVRRVKRRGLLISQGMSKNNPGFLFPLDGVDKSELDELVRAILAKGGITKESEVQAVVEKAEQDAEVRLQVAEANAEVRRLMSLRAQGLKLMSIGFRKWVEVFHPAIKYFKAG